MKKIILSFTLLIILSGCTQDVNPQKANVDDGKIEVNNIDRLSSASDIIIDNEYQFAYSDAVVEDFPTFKNTGILNLQVDEDATIEISTSNDSEFTDASSSIIELEAGDAVDISSDYQFYSLSSDDIVNASISTL